MNASGRRPPSAVEQIRDLAWSGKHAEAVEAASAALEGAKVPARRLELLGLRSESLLALGDLERASADASEMMQLGRKAAKASSKAQALIRQCLVQMRTGEIAAAVRSARGAVAAARASRQPELQAESLFRLAEAQFRER